MEDYVTNNHQHWLEMKAIRIGGAGGRLNTYVCVRPMIVPNLDNIQGATT